MTPQERMGRILCDLPIHLDLHAGAFVAGGFVVRCLLGLEIKDIDIWVPTEDLGLMGTICITLKNAGWTQSTGPNGSIGNRTVWHPPTPGPDIDLIPTVKRSPYWTCLNFDWRCAKVATDGKNMWHERGALEDIEALRLHCTRRTSVTRFLKYQEMGFKFPDGVDVDDVLLSETATINQIFGLEEIPLGPTAAERMR